MALTQVQPGMLGTPQPYNFKNRIINGAMVIDQRNAGASVTATDAGYTLDRWQTFSGAASKFTVQQTTTAPTGFNYSLKVTSSSAYTAGAGEAFSVNQNIEGYNVADLGFGTANAKTITISFWVQSSLTGTFSAAIRNSAANRSYPFTYTVSSANTWEQKSVTIAGDTTGTWLTTNGIGLALTFNLGSGSNFLGTANTWGTGFYVGATGSQSVVGTNGATFYITGVQLEVGVTATTFDYRPYGTELQLCQRYYTKLISGNSSTGGILGLGITVSTIYTVMALPFRQQMRATPALTQANMISSDSVTFDAAVSAISGNGTSDAMYITLTHAAVTAGKTVNVRAATNTTGYIALEAEL